jgi:hypothetical protein
VERRLPRSADIRDQFWETAAPAVVRYDKDAPGFLTEQAMTGNTLAQRRREVRAPAISDALPL